MKLLLDEMLSDVIAQQLRKRGHDVLAAQDPALFRLRGIDDCLVLHEATLDQRAVVTDNIADFLACHRARLHEANDHHGLVLFTNNSFPRHRHEAFVSAMVESLDALLTQNQSAATQPASTIHWRAPAPLDD